MDYFKLNQFCILVEGEKEGSIYDLLHGRVYPLDQDKTKILKLLDSGNPINEISEILNIPDTQVSSLISTLKKENVGLILKKSYIINKIKIIPSIWKLRFFESPPPSSRLYIEINNRCENECWFCGYFGIKRTLGCMGCNKWNEHDDELQIEKIREILREAKKLGFTHVFLTGGNLFETWEIVESCLLSTTLFNTFITVSSINLNGSNLQKMNNTIHENLTYIFQIPLVENDKIRQLKKTIAMAKNLKTNALFDVVYNISDMAKNPQEVKNIGNILDNSRVYSYIEIADENAFKNLAEMEEKLLAQEKIQPTDLFRFSHNTDYNTCLGGAVSIAHDGNVYPCRLLRNHPVGNIYEHPLAEIIKGDLEQFWNLTKDMIAPCSGCSLRYTCYECRAIEESLTEDIYATALCPKRNTHEKSNNSR